MKACSTNPTRAGKYFLRPVGEATRVDDGPCAANSLIAAGSGPAVFLGDHNTLAAFFCGGVRVRAADRVVDLGAPRRLDDALLAHGRAALGAQTGEYALVAVGGGTVGDLAKLLAAERGGNFVLAATCASMNGWLSPNASILRGGTKQSVAAVAPTRLVLDDAILDAAPPALRAAGIADALAGAWACRDWHLAHFADAAPFDSVVADAVLASLDPLVAALRANAAPTVAASGAVRSALVDALLAGGLAMREAHTSSPASGAEHLVAHAVELHEVATGAPASFHGLAVGIGTLLVAALWEVILASRALFPSTPASSDLGSVSARTDALSAWFPAIAPSAREVVAQKFARESERPDPRGLLERSLLAGPGPGTVAAARADLISAGAPVRANALGLSAAFLKRALLHGRDLRDRYTVFDLAYALGVLPDRADDVVDRSGLCAS